MDVLRKELAAIYERQNLGAETLDGAVTRACRRDAEAASAIDRDCHVITDVATDTCHIAGGDFARLIGLCEAGTYVGEMDSADEDVIYNRIHPEDLVDKRMLEYEFLKFVDTLPPGEKLNHRATCRLRIRDRGGKDVYVDNSTRVMRLSPGGRIWLILCRYDLSPRQEPAAGIEPRLVDGPTGRVSVVALAGKRDAILTPREKEILNLIKEGKPSKQIADRLGISIHTVNRHRQNILEKLSVGNSVEAVTAAAMMRLL